ncbi:MAG: PEP-CTERM sorting domain-containing protein [Candidatus Omnitrophica bacterium]|nr:PEP-CTERM sorting domain-containing protein [Candidatus Omnitrophota bacterium]
MIDRVTYESSNPGIALTRFPDGEGAWFEHTAISSLTASPGMTAEGTSYLLLSGPGPDTTPQPTVPEPSSFMLFSLSVMSLALRRRRSKCASLAPL